MTFTPASHDCPLCPRLAAFRQSNRQSHAAFFNAPVPSFGDLDAQLLVVGLAPGLKGANRSGRPFTGDYAGLVLYSSLAKYGFAGGEYDPEKVAGGVARGAWRRGDAVDHHEPRVTTTTYHDSFRLLNTRITNAVRCVPPQNKPEPSEIRQCNGFLKAEIQAMPNVRVILTLGQIAHKAVIMAFGLKQSAYAFAHGVEHSLPSPFAKASGDRLATSHLSLLSSYHCSRYNINTGALTQAMFDSIIERAGILLQK